MEAFIPIVFLALTGISLLAQTPVNLKLNLEKGKLYRIKSTSKQAIQQTANGQQFAVNASSNTVISYKVLRQENEMMDIEFKFDTIASKISSVMFNRETNSAKPAGSEPLEKIMNKMSTYKLVAKISTAGKFIDFVNYGKFKDSVLFVIDSIPATKRDQAKTQADGLLKESALKSMIEPLFAYLPEKAVKTGDTWETSYFLMANNMSMLSLNSYTLKGVENNRASIAGKAEIESMPSTDPAAQMQQELKGTMTSDGTLDITTGLISNNTTKGHIEGTLTMKNNGNEMKIPMSVDSQVETSLIK
ncbi:MAG: DUF6263 family protein [Bacteroidota bacterium]|nr:DUF6263 family protein [Bacteroidota bacterium]